MKLLDRNVQVVSAFFILGWLPVWPTLGLHQETLSLNGCGWVGDIPCPAHFRMPKYSLLLFQRLIKGSSSHLPMLITFYPSDTNLTNCFIFLIFMWLGHMSPLSVQAGKPKQRGVLQSIVHSTINVVCVVLHGAVMGTEQHTQHRPATRPDFKVMQDKKVPLNNKILTLIPNDTLNVSSVCCISHPGATPCSLSVVFFLQSSSQTPLPSSDKCWEMKSKNASEYP